MKKIFVVTALALAGCSTHASRMAACEAEGVSRDTCYMADSNRENAIIAARPQSYNPEYFQKHKHHHHAEQHAQAAKANKANCNYLEGLIKVEGEGGMNSDQAILWAKCPQAKKAKPDVKPFVKHFGDVEVKRDKLGLISIDGKPAVEIENTGETVSYEAGIFIVTIYKNGKVAVMKDRVFQGYAK